MIFTYNGLFPLVAVCRCDDVERINQNAGTNVRKESILQWYLQPKEKQQKIIQDSTKNNVSNWIIEIVNISTTLTWPRNSPTFAGLPPIIRKFPFTPNVCVSDGGKYLWRAQENEHTSTVLGKHNFGWKKNCNLVKGAIILLTKKD